MPKKPFIFNDESVTNSYGFTIPTKGISLSRFKKNPMMLDSHYNSTRSVLGSWNNIKVDKGLLMGDPVFDTEDESVKLIEGKVERGFIKSCSMGITFNREDLKIVAGKLILMKCELYEVSIVAVPSNANSIRLYADGSDTPLTDAEVQTLCLSIAPARPEINPTPKNTENENMKVTLSHVAAIALGFASDALEQDVADINARIQTLAAEKSAAELKLSAMQSAKEADELKGINTQVEAALKAGQITAENKQKFVELGIANRELLTSTLSAIPVKQSLGAQVTAAAGAEGVKTVEDFMKLSLEAQLSFKATSPEAYLQLFTKKQ